MLCPNCLFNAENLEPVLPNDPAAGLRCPSCKEPVPRQYQSDYATHPPVVYFALGLPGHGKGLLLAKLFQEFERVGELWQEFYYTPVQERFLAPVRELQQALERGDKLEAGRMLFKKPAILRLDGVPRLGKCQLIVFDAAPEEEPDTARDKHLHGFLTRSPVVTFTLSPSAIQLPSELTDFLTRHTQLLSDKGASSRNQTLLVALTKCDELAQEEGFPVALKKTLAEDELAWLTSEEEDTDGGIAETSGIIEAWLETRRTTMNFVRRARAEFKRVIYAPVTVFGAEGILVSGEMVNLSPRVWTPLLAAWQEQIPEIRRSRRRETTRKIGKAAKESVSEMTARVVGGLLGLIEGAIWGGLLWALVATLGGWLTGMKSDDIVSSATQQGWWGLVWGALIWFAAGMTDVGRGAGTYHRDGLGGKAARGESRFCGQVDSSYVRRYGGEVSECGGVV